MIQQDVKSFPLKKQHNGDRKRVRWRIRVADPCLEGINWSRKAITTCDMDREIDKIQQSCPHTCRLLNRKLYNIYTIYARVIIDVRLAVMNMYFQVRMIKQILQIAGNSFLSNSHRNIHTNNKVNSSLLRLTKIDYRWVNGYCNQHPSVTFYDVNN